MYISVQQEDFSIQAVVDRLTSGRREVGAVVTFSGRVRDLSPANALQSLFLEHYPGMTQAALTDICQQAIERWGIDDVAVIHRVGELQPAENIVLVVVVSAHRKQAFESCEYIMDYLKTQAPFWKKEISEQGEHWVEPRETDQVAADKW